jgi:hypothetical protein
MLIGIGRIIAPRPFPLIKLGRIKRIIHPIIVPTPIILGVFVPLIGMTEAVVPSSRTRIISIKISTLVPKTTRAEDITTAEPFTIGPFIPVGNNTTGIKVGIIKIIHHREPIISISIIVKLF